MCDEWRGLSLYFSVWATQFQKKNVAAVVSLAQPGNRNPTSRTDSDAFNQHAKYIRKNYLQAPY